MKDFLFRLTPLGRADSEVDRFLSGRLEEEELEGYRRSLEKYRSAKLFHISIKILLYAGVITSIATTVGLNQAYIIQKIASYIGVTFLLIFYGASKYTSDVYREDYHVQREIIVAKASRRGAE